MIFTLWRKLFRDVLVALIIIALLLFAFELLWVKVVQQVTTQIAPMLSLASLAAGRAPDWLIGLFFDGPGKVIQTVLGGEILKIDDPQQLLAIGFVHPLVQAILCIWAVGRAAGAVAGEVDRGTMELLLAQPIRRSHLVAAHLLVDLAVLPVLCLALWAGSSTGAEFMSPFIIDPDVYREAKLPVPNPIPVMAVDTAVFGPALANVFALMFAISGITIWISSRGRSRNRVIGAGILVILVQFIVNVVGQLWTGAAWLRPFSVFYYYQPQRIALQGKWTVDPGVDWGTNAVGPVNVVVVLLLVGAVGYLLAWQRFCRRDIPAPL